MRLTDLTPRLSGAEPNVDIVKTSTAYLVVLVMDRFAPSG
jgi:hypothetical protein